MIIPSLSVSKVHFWEGSVETVLLKAHLALMIACNTFYFLSQATDKFDILFGFGAVPVNNFSVMSGRFLGLNQL